MQPRRALREFLLEPLLDALCPARCPVCALALDGDQPACPEHLLPDGGPAGPRCRRCADRQPPALAAVPPERLRCAACRRRPPPFHRVLALGDYREDAGLRAWILALKHGRRRDLAPDLGRALARRLAVHGPLAGALLVPVPLHPLRRLERGIDQARLLAREAAAHGGAEWRPLLRRTRWTAPQGAPGSRSRSANVRGAFALRAPSLVQDLAGRAVWVVDDVLTSGATAAGCTRALTRAGARRVGVLCLARVSTLTEVDRNAGAGGQ